MKLHKYFPQWRSQIDYVNGSKFDRSCIKFQTKLEYHDENDIGDVMQNNMMVEICVKKMRRWYEGKS